MSKDVTMRDIAKKLNISAVSVSKAISGKEGVGDEMRELILNTAKSMGYEYTVKHNTYNIGVLVSQMFISDSAFYSKLFQNLAIEFGNEGHSCTLEIINHKDESEGNLPVSVADRRLDGVIILGPIGKACMKKILHIDIPCIFVDNDTVDDNADCIVSDNVYGSHMLTNYLFHKGHRKIAFVGKTDASNSIMDRYLGYLKGLIQNGLEVRPEYVLSDRDTDGYITDVVFPTDFPDAFVCNCDEVAFHLIKQLTSKGIKVPDDVSVVGFDDFIFATMSTPELTTFRVNMKKMSRVAFETMISRIENKGADRERRVISGEIVIRDSVRNV